MEQWLIVLTTVVGSVAASSGFWAYWQRDRDRGEARTKLLLGLAHDQIVRTGMTYLERGWVTKDEYEDIIKYLYRPYSTFGGNGLADKVMEEVKRLPMISRPPYQMIDDSPQDRHDQALIEKRKHNE